LYDQKVISREALKLFLKKDLFSSRSRPALKWMNRFAFVAVSLSVFAWISVMSIMEGLQKDIIENHLNSKAHLLWESVPTHFSPPSLSADWKAKILSIETSLQSEALLEVPEDPNDRENSLRSGVVVQSSTELKKGEIDIGSDLSAQISSFIGDQVKLRSAWKLEAPALNLKIRKIIHTGVYEMDKALVKVSTQDMQSWLGLENKISRIEIRLKDPFKAQELQKPLSGFLGVELKSWEELDQALWSSLKLEKFALGFALFCMILLASLSVNMALSVRVSEKVREISLLRSMGFTKNDIFRLYLLQGTLIGVLSCLLGTLLAYFFSQAVSKNLVLPSYYYSTKIPVEWNPQTVVILCIVSILLCLWASYRPAQRAMSVDIAQGLRF
jgi:lipoprotein-releasing system permease protein